MGGGLVDKAGVAQQVIHGDVEEALDLRGVEIHRQHAVSARAAHRVGSGAVRTDRHDLEVREGLFDVLDQSFAELSALAVDDKDRHGVLILSCVLFSARKPLKRQRKGINIPLAGRLIPW